ncbi:ABC transporter C family member 8 isoform X2 [Cucurbita pepo subsp. pepo]|uniref:ABC transporter C family member 8 isoform X2 n=1 Tax=Cucurbita pepo subsp. pepo TaxID=3664 RepID=UPI000C9D997B|nr:ABC transporter C family member 8 isoform X2 [Cucurbita pepo subsp. pepo]
MAEPLLDKQKEEPESSSSSIGQAGLFSKLIFSWINPLLSLGYSRALTLADVPPLDSEDEAEFSYQRFSDVWDSLLRENGSSGSGNFAFQAIKKVHMNENVLIAFYTLLRTLSVVVSPLILFAFVEYLTGNERNLRDGVTIVGLLIVCKVFESLGQRHWFFESRRSGMKMRSALMAAVYRKLLKLSSLGRMNHSAGEIVNYIAVDAYRMGEFPWWFHTSWASGLQLVLSIAVLFWVVGAGAFLGLVPLIICGFLSVPFAKSLQKCQFHFMVAQDERLRSTSEVLNNMKIIKLQSWEEKFQSLIDSLREKEFKWLKEMQMQKTYNSILYWIYPTIVSAVVFYGCVLFQSSPLNASTIFTVLATMRTVSEPMRMLPEALSILIQVKVSFDRLNTFLLDDELNKNEVIENSSNDLDKMIKIRNGNFAWDPESGTLTLKEVDLDIERGQKVAVCGSVGAGKSSLLLAILGEIPKLTGSVQVKRSIAYVSQTAWIQSGTIRENILNGKPMDTGRYKNAIKACALDEDINSFDHGDLTEIGQRGLNMSGGQKQRIQLARAVYNDADIYLLDDPFSAVDAHTAATLFDECAMTALDKKTVVLVTHQVEFVSEVDKILVIEGGKITQSGSYEDLLTTGTTFEKLVNAHKDSLIASDTSKSENPRGFERVDTMRCEKSDKENIRSKNICGVQLTEEEEKEMGDVGWKPFWDYITVSKASPLLYLSVISQCGFVVFQAAATYWLAIAINFPHISSTTMIGIYTAISVFSTLFIYCRSLLAALFGLRASKAFFSGFTNSIFNAPMSFFDATPVGRILTRASTDLSVLDFDIPFSAIFVVTGAMDLLAVIAIVAFVTWEVLLIAIPAIVASTYVQSYYLPSARELIRINGTTKAPVMNCAAETSLGAVTIRAFDMTERFFQKFVKLIDTDASLLFHSNATTEWLVLRIETLQNLTLVAVASLLVLLPRAQTTDPGLVGLSLSYALFLSIIYIFMARFYCYLSNYIISVERIKQYMHLPVEPPAIVEKSRPPLSWPTKGRIELKCLKGITCTFQEGTRVGVVGRTGSGKTTLISALFRLVEPEHGRIIIDGVDICSIGLKDLRMKLSIIPQEPTLFRGSIRTNLDPLGLYSDDEIWKALEKCQLRDVVSHLPNRLDSSVSDEGENWSVGQRQLFCLGRVLLKRNRILVLDEATASIDSATDTIVQGIIRQEFSECSVITVAHRVPTVIDSDKVMVLSFGHLVENEEPSKLMETNSYFSRLVAEYWASSRRDSSHNLPNQFSI